MVKQKYFNGEAPSGKMTSISGGASPAIKWLYNQNRLPHSFSFKNLHILDYGCGRNARNSEWLEEERGNIFRIFRYDPYWGKEDENGWVRGEISNTLPDFPYIDIVFTSFVLNVVTKKVQDSIIADCNKIAGVSYHIVRNDVVKAAHKAMNNNDPITTAFCRDHFNGDNIEDFARFGFATKKGFQRQIDYIKGFDCIKETSSYRIFCNA